MRAIRTLTTAVLAATLAVPALAWAQAAASADGYPKKAIHIVVPYTAGAINDVLARRVGAKLSEALKQPVIVENRPGGGTAIGTEYVARAAPDGYTLLQIAASHSVNPSLVPDLPYDSIKDFSFITLAATSPYVLIVAPALPVKTVADLVAMAKAKPGALSFSSTGNGGTAHMMGELLNSLGGVKTLHIPYKGGAQATTDLVSNQVQFSFSTYTGAQSFIKANRVRAIATTGAKRMSALPDLPTIGETLPGYDAAGWWGYAAPAGTPPAIIARLNQELVRILQAPEMKETFSAEGVEMLGTTPDAFKQHIQREMGVWGKLVKDANITVN
ncbi:tripartite tricarboxylate transporter substrate binding protein [Pigmentiphaga litoralis]|uniref:Tripartite-type tricarboxylate transporter receptor subunit TctC n=1 Tax=Pigmentiphaga litoralis TaxID=516702 RepID=A0A7Y9LJW9_9BURK|nr:tripartite tricarboxylate transporter substrate binding protein [Pigmentiphaga litoralis]NYE23992.1 tripartite-type tricarboxylate transporter receptor subunit TctC [Pigmentiphaga litoralis]NYE82394.1 tripartite-type tricarboxylate transporter receptor subunit TctC [Pigmentiphaga litoralis]